MLKSFPFHAVIALGLWQLVAGIAHQAVPSGKETKSMIRTTHVRLLVNDYDAEYRFLRDVLGFAPTYGKEGENYADFDCNGVCVALFKRTLMSDDVKTTQKPLRSDSQDSVALIFGVGDVDKATAELKQKGVAFVTQPHDRKDWGI